MLWQHSFLIKARVEAGVHARCKEQRSSHPRHTLQCAQRDGVATTRDEQHPPTQDGSGDSPSSSPSTPEEPRLLIRRLKQSLAPKRPHDTNPLLRPKLASGATPLHNAEGWDSDDDDEDDDSGNGKTPQPARRGGRSREDTSSIHSVPMRARKTIMRDDSGNAPPTIVADMQQTPPSPTAHTPPYSSSSSPSSSRVGTNGARGSGGRQQARSRTSMVGVAVDSDDEDQEEDEDDMHNTAPRGGGSRGGMMGQGVVSEGRYGTRRVGVAQETSTATDAGGDHAVSHEHAQYTALMQDDDIIGQACIPPPAVRTPPQDTPSAAPLPAMQSSTAAPHTHTAAMHTHPPMHPRAHNDGDDNIQMEAEIGSFAQELSQQDALADSEEEDEHVNLEDVAHFLVEKTGVDISRARACVAKSLHYGEQFNARYSWLPSISRNTKFMYKFLSTLGLAPADIGHILCTNNDFMRRNTRSMVERVAYLQWVGIPTDQWATVIRKCPRVRSRLLPLTKALVQDVGMTLPQFRTLVVRYPRVFSFSAERVREVQAFLMEQGFNAEELPLWLVRIPSLLSSSPEGRMRRNVEWLQEKGLDKEEARRMLRHFPGLLMYATKTLEAKHKVLVEYMQTDLRCVATFPSFFGYSLDRRILPRTAYMYSLGRPLPRGLQTYEELIAERDMGVSTPIRSINWNIMSQTDDKFAVYIAGTPSARYREFLSTFDPMGPLPAPVPQPPVDEEMIMQCQRRAKRRAARAQASMGSSDEEEHGGGEE